MKIVSTVPRARFEKHGTKIPEGIELLFLNELDASALSAVQDEADGVLAQSVDFITREFINNCPNLKIIQTEGVGFDKVDGAAARERGINVCNNRDVNKTTVAEHVVCSIMMMMA